MKNLEFASAKRCFKADLFIGAVGYETRARFCLEKLHDGITSILGLSFAFHNVLDHQRNLVAFESRGAHIMPGCGPNVPHEIEKYVIAKGSGTDEPIQLLLDISTMSREMMANVALAVDLLSKRRRLCVRVCYAPATFERPHQTPPMKIAGPVKPEFAGWSLRPESALILVMGLGYEENLALGAVSYLEPTRAHLFIPRGLDERYEPLVRQEASKIGRHISTVNLAYDLTNWPQSFSLLWRTFEQLLAEGRVVVVPFGPKVFAWNALCLSLLDEFREIAVWRFSADVEDKPKNRFASGQIASLDLTLG